MADDYGTCPNDVYEDERLEDAPLGTLAGFVLVMVQCDDHGLFEGRPRSFARKVGVDATEVEELFASLEQRGLVSFYDAPGSAGVARRVGQVVDYHRYRGHPFRVSNPSKRGPSLFPSEDGSYFGGRVRGSEVPATGQDKKTEAASRRPASGQSSASKRPVVGQDKKTEAASRRPASGQSRARDQHSTAQHSTAQNPSPHGEGGSVQHVASASAPSQPAPPPDGGRAEVAAGVPVETKVAPPPSPTPPRPKFPPCPVYGTPEWTRAEAEGDWEALGWRAYRGESEAERLERLRPNVELIKAEEDARRAADEAAWLAEQAAKKAAARPLAGGVT